MRRLASIGLISSLVLLPSGFVLLFLAAMVEYWLPYLAAVSSSFG
jgi:hypothetical protein